MIGNLVIKFNQSEQTQTVVSEQIKDNQVLSAVKNHLQTTGNSTISQSELTNFLANQKKVDNSTANSLQTPLAKNPLFWTAAGIIGVFVIAGLSLLVTRVKKSRSSRRK